MQLLHLYVHDRETRELHAAERLWEVGVPKDIALVCRHQVQSRLDLACNHEGCLTRPISVLLELANCRDDAWCEVHNLILDGEGLVQLDRLDLSQVSDAHLERPRDKAYRRAAHAARNGFSRFPSLGFLITVQVNQVLDLIFLSLVRLPLEMELREKLYLL